MVETYQEGQGTSPAKSEIDDMIKEALNSPESNEIKLHDSPSHVEYGNFTGWLIRKTDHRISVNQNMM